MSKIDRRLAAILVADIAGYSKLMGADDEGTIAALKEHQAVILPMVETFGGRIVDLAGDGILAQFPSAAGAFEAAIAIQNTMRARNDGVAPDRQMQFRIGVSQGDIVQDGDRIYGDGVNVAARIQALAKPGGICISGKVRDEIIDRVDVELVPLGERQLKNIVRPVPVYAIGDKTVTTAVAVGVSPTLAVLPFENLSSDAEQEYFADGIVEDIITALSRFRTFAVVARNSTFVYKGQAVDIRRVGKDLGVRYVLEGSVRRAGERLRITAQLVDATTGEHLWAEKFDGPLADVFDVQDRITESVVGVVEPTIQFAEIANSRRERPGSLAAYDLCLRALPLHRSGTMKDNVEAYSLLSRALELEPDNPVLLAWTMDTLLHRTILGWTPVTDDDRGRIEDYTHRALANARDTASVLARCANALIQVVRDSDQGLAILRRAMRVNPNSVEVIGYAGLGNLIAGSVEEALAHFRNALRLSPRDPYSFVMLTGVGHCHMILGNYAEALAVCQLSMASNAGYDPTYWYLIASNAQLGKLDAARNWLAKYLTMNPGMTVARIAAAQPPDPLRFGSIVEGLRLAGMPEN
jgi:adenylate cyclase